MKACYQVMIIKRLLEPNSKSIYTAILWTAILLTLSFKAPSVNPKYIFQYQDKVVHFTFYFVFVFLWFRVLVFKSATQKRHQILLFIISVALGIIIEILQGAMTTTRQADIFDVFANTVGSMGWLFLSRTFYIAKY